jgi:hypothetical protein
MVYTTVNRAGIPIGMEGLTPTSGTNIKTMTQQLNQPASSYSTSSPSTSPTGTGSTPTGSSPTSTYTTPSTTPITSPTSKPATSYSIPRTPTSGTVAQYPSAPTTTPASTAPPQTIASQSSMAQTAVSQLSTTVSQATGTTPPTGVAHLWIGWKIEPWEEEIIQKFIEAFEHGKHVHRPIELPPMGGVLAPIPGAPAPGAPVVTIQPQGTSNQYQLTA